MLSTQMVACTSLSGNNNQNNSAYQPYKTLSKSKVITKQPTNQYGKASSYKVGGKRYYVLNSPKGYDKIGRASWYGKAFHGRRTSSRERYNMFGMTAASTSLPIQSYVKVTNLYNGRSVIVKINDRGPFKSSRIIDLSYAAAKKLGYTNKGTALVRVTAVPLS